MEPAACNFVIFQKIEMMHAQIADNGYEKPSPPSTRKCDVIDVHNMTEVDKYASTEVKCTSCANIC